MFTGAPNRAFRILRVGAAVCLIGACPLPIDGAQAAPNSAARARRERLRTVIDNERGSIFTAPVHNAWADIGAYVGAPKSDKFVQLQRDAIKVVHGRFHLVKPSDNTTWNWFPYDEFKEYEQSEIAAGRDALLVTSQYLAQPRPVLWAWSLGSISNGSPPITAAQQWEQAINVGDERFIRFWINRYARRVLLAGLAGLPHLWIGLDECAFNPDLYGVLDDNGRYHTPVKWDPPFPQTDQEYYDSLKQFFGQVKVLAPDLKLMCNLGSMKDWGQFDSVFENVPGLMVEELFRYDSSAYVRLNVHYNFLTSLSRFTNKGRVTILRTSVPDDPSRIRTAYAAYQLVNGPNSFFAPRFDQTIDEVPVDRYALQRDRLAEPTAEMQSEVATGAINDGYRLYWREYKGGVVYLNLSGSTREVELPRGNSYVNREGTSVKTVVLPDMTGDYVMLRGTSLKAPPPISPRIRGRISGPVGVTIGPGCGGIVRYTTDGTEPGELSTAYTGEILLTARTVVKARCYNDETVATSVTSVAAFSVTSDTPTIWLLGTPQGPLSNTFYPTIAVKPKPSSDVVVTYRIAKRSESGCDVPHREDIVGAVTIPRWASYALIPVSILDAQRLLLTDAVQVCLDKSTAGTLGRPVL